MCEIIGNDRYGGSHNRSATDKILGIAQMLDKRWECSETVYRLFIEFKKTYNLVRRELLFSILVDFGVTMKLFRLIGVCLNKSYGNICIGTYLCDNFPIQNDLK
jgi:hypothetical protein